MKRWAMPKCTGIDEGSRPRWCTDHILGITNTLTTFNGCNKRYFLLQYNKLTCRIVIVPRTSKHMGGISWGERLIGRGLNGME